MTAMCGLLVSAVASGGCLGCLLTRALGQCPGHRQVIASADPLEAIADAVLDPPQGVLVGSLRAQRQDAREGT
jgi:hypothetical protein